MSASPARGGVALPARTLSWSASSRASQLRSSEPFTPLRARDSSAYARAWRVRTRRLAALEPLERVLAHGFEHPEAPAVAGHQAVLGERADAVQRLRSADALAAASVKPPTNTPSWANSRCAVRVEQVVAPADRGAQRPLAVGRVARAGAEQVEPAPEAVEDLARGEDLDARRRELDRQRQAVEPAADLRDRASSSASTQPGSTARARRTNSATAGSAASGGSASSCSAASCSGARLVTTSFEGGDAASTAELPGGVEQLLEVVDHEQQLAAAISPSACPSSAPTRPSPARRARRNVRLR